MLKDCTISISMYTGHHVPLASTGLRLSDRDIFRIFSALVDVVVAAVLAGASPIALCERFRLDLSVFCSSSVEVDVCVDTTGVSFIPGGVVFAAVEIDDCVTTGGVFLATGGMVTVADEPATGTTGGATEFTKGK